MGDRIGNPIRIFIRFSAFHRNLDQFGGTFCIFNELFSQSHQNLIKDLLKWLALAVAVYQRPGQAICDQKSGIICAGIAVYGDVV